MKKYFTICGDVVIASSRFGLAPFSSNKKLQLSCAAIMKNIAANRICDIFGVLRTPRYRSPAGCDILTIFEFSSSNGFVSFNINFECRHIEILGDENNNHFFYLVFSPFGLWFDTSCDELGYEEWEIYYDNCITAFQG